MNLNKLIKNKISDKNCKFFIVLYALFNAILFLFICSKSSPLYVLNDWCDANSFFTMGKGMANGLIIYKDLFEQKGPLLYLIHAISYFISNNTFLGVFIFEIISFTVFLYFTGKIITLYCRKVHLVWSIPLISFSILSSFVFIFGDSAEEFCLPFLSISLYYFFNYYKNIFPNKMPAKQIMLNGFIAGCVLWIKYTILGFWIGFAAFLCIGLLINKKVKEAFLSGVYFIIGMIIATIPWILYFIVNNALGNMIEVYFIVNMSAYSESASILKRVIMAIVHALAYAKKLWLFSIITGIGYMYIIVTKKIIENIYGKIALTLTVLVSIICIYYGTNYRYYFLILMPYIVLGIIAIIKMLEKYANEKLLNLLFLFTPLYIIGFTILTCAISPNFGFRKAKKEDLVQYQFAEIINQKEHATLLNYGFLDGGFFTVTDISPNVKYFSAPNIKYENYPEIIDEQNRYIKEALVDFIVIKVENQDQGKDIPYLYENYEKIKERLVVEEAKYYYMLFEKK